jgi:hypothetical protein
MNTFVKATVLALAAVATVATTIQVAEAGERNWRKHHRPWHKRTVVIGVHPGVVVARPRIVYRDAPVVIRQAPAYDREVIYDDDTVYADPDQDYGNRAYRDDAPDADDYAAPRDYDYGDDEDYDNRAATEDDYFPERPQARVKRDSTERISKQAVIDSEPRRKPKKADTVKDAEAATLRPWTKEWKDWCSGRFSSFNPENGTYLGYDQKRHFCKAG